MCQSKKVNEPHFLMRFLEIKKGLLNFVSEKILYVEQVKQSTMKKLIIGIIASMSLTSCTAAKNIIQTPQTIKESISAKMQEEKNDSTIQYTFQKKVTLYRVENGEIKVAYTSVETYRGSDKKNYVLLHGNYIRARYPMKYGHIFRQALTYKDEKLFFSIIEELEFLRSSETKAQ